MVINEFRGKYYFLSNFYTANVEYKGIKYLNNESAFQSCKLKDIEKRKSFSHLNPSEAKRKGRRVQLRNDWEEVKYDIMLDIVRAKFTQNEDLKIKLLETGDAYLEEGNTWGDRIWGVCDGRGKNWLGKILMQVREELKQIK